MADQRPSTFITGANAVVKFGEAKLAYCTDVSYSLDVQHIPIESMGTYEVHANEPVAVMVNGSFSVIRYVRKSGESSINDSGTVDTSEGAEGGNTLSDIGSADRKKAFDQMDPSLILSSQTVDLEVHVKTAIDGSGTEQSIIKIGDVRCSRKAASMNKRGVMVDNYTFVARTYADGTIGNDPALTKTPPPSA